MCQRAGCRSPRRLKLLASPASPSHNSPLSASSTATESSLLRTSGPFADLRVWDAPADSLAPDRRVNAERRLTDLKAEAHVAMSARRTRYSLLVAALLLLAFGGKGRSAPAPPLPRLC